MQEELAQSHFAARREQLLSRLPDNAVVVLYAAQETLRNGDVHYPFRQDSYFWYFTGFPEAEAIAVLQKKQGKVHYTLYNAPRNPDEEIWNGRIIGQQDAVEHYGADESYPLTDIGNLPKQLAAATHIYTILGTHASQDQRITQALHDAHNLTGRGGAPIEGIMDLRRIADDMRLHKTEAEKALLHTAGKISAEGHHAGMLATRAGGYEYEVQAAIEATFRRYGCSWSYGSIVAAGANACCLHYHNNNAVLKDGELMMVDAGAEFAGYAGDISRTYPINGSFSRDQQALYEVVLNAQEEAIKLARPGIRHLELHQITIRNLMQGMLDIGIIKGTLDGWMENNRFKQFYMHGTGHWLGLDVHDVGVYLPDGGQSRIYEPDMVITIEPGLYIQADDTSVDERWRGMGIRIEDDIIITAGEAEITSSAIPKHINDIEAILKQR